MMADTRHPTFQQLRALALGESPSYARLTEHLKDCGDCRQTIASVRDVVAIAREEFSPRAPEGGFDRIAARVVSGDKVLLPVAAGRRTVSRAARIAVVTGSLLGVAGIAAALPGSPIRGWIGRALADRTAPDSAVTAQPAAAPAVSGVALPLAAGEMWVAIDSAPRAVRIRVRLVESPAIEVRGTGAAARAEFRPRAGGIGVARIPSDSGEIQVDVPRAAQRFVLRVGDVPFLIKENGRLRVLSAADTMGTELLFSPGVRR